MISFGGSNLTNYSASNRDRIQLGKKIGVEKRGEIKIVESNTWTPKSVVFDIAYI